MWHISCWEEKGHQCPSARGVIVSQMGSFCLIALCQFLNMLNYLVTHNWLVISFCNYISQQSVWVYSGLRTYSALCLNDDVGKTNAAFVHTTHRNRSVHLKQVLGLKAVGSGADEVPSPRPAVCSDRQFWQQWKTVQGFCSVLWFMCWSLEPESASACKDSHCGQWSAHGWAHRGHCGWQHWNAWKCLSVFVWLCRKEAVLSWERYQCAVTPFRPNKNHLNQVILCTEWSWFMSEAI